MGAYSVGRLQGGQYKVLFSLEIEEFVHQIPPLKTEEDGFPTRYWKEGSSWAQADVLTLTAPTVATDIDAQLGPPLGHPPSIVARMSLIRSCRFIGSDGEGSKP